MHRLMLEQEWDYCPRAWKNFTNCVQDAEGLRDGQGIDDDTINKYLSPYCGKWVRVRWEDPLIEFETEEDATAFTLRYS
jgi:hypothetical protein